MLEKNIFLLNAHIDCTRSTHNSFNSKFIYPAQCLKFLAYSTNQLLKQLQLMQHKIQLVLKLIYLS